jgi:hypothetical protein
MTAMQDSFPAEAVALQSGRFEGRISPDLQAQQKVELLRNKEPLACC